MTMHILHIVESFAAGCLTALSMLTHAVRGNFRHSVAHDMRTETPENFAALFPPDVVFYRVPMAMGIADGLRACQELSALIRRTRPDVVHCHSSKAGVYGRLAARACGVPSVYTPHGYAFLRTDVLPPVRTLFKGIEWLASRAGDAIVACGTEEYALARQLAGPHHVVTCVPNALDPPELACLPRPHLPFRNNTRVLVGTCGRAVAQRAPELFSSIACRLQDAADWIWIGAERNAEPLPHHVHCTGWVSRAYALGTMAELDIYLQTSRWEGLSYSLLEAMALGKPVVATRIPANEVVIDHGITGLLGNGAEELAEHVLRLASDPELRSRLGRAAQSCIADQYDARRTYQEYATLYHQLAHTRR